MGTTRPVRKSTGSRVVDISFEASSRVAHHVERHRLNADPHGFLPRGGCTHEPHLERARSDRRRWAANPLARPDARLAVASPTRVSLREPPADGRAHRPEVW